MIVSAYPLLAPGFAVLVISAGVAATAAASEVPARCLKCHPESVIVGQVAKFAAAERERKLDAFLAKHFAADPTERAAIVSALKEKAAQR